MFKSFVELKCHPNEGPPPRAKLGRNCDDKWEKKPRVKTSTERVSILRFIWLFSCKFSKK
jgi:hypothetical protein